MKTCYERIPELLPDLVIYDHWVCFQLTAEKANGKRDKLPKYMDATGVLKNAKTNDPATWMTWDEATRCALKYNLDGVGYVFSKSDENGKPEDPFVGIDLDLCRDNETGKLEEWAERIVNKFSSYTEVTPSGKGLHIICKGRLPRGFKNGNIEAYEDGRFLLGDLIEGVPAEAAERTAELESFYAEYGKRGSDAATKRQSKRPEHGGGLGDIEKAARALDRLAQWRCDDHESWLKIGMSLRELGDVGFSLWLEWSYKSPKYDQRDCEKRWRSFSKGGNAAGEITLGSLFYWADEDDPSGRKSKTSRKESVERRDDLNAGEERSPEYEANEELDEKPEENEGAAKEKTSKATLLLRLVEDQNVELFHNAEGRCFATFRVNNHFETYPIRSQTFKRWLSRQFWETHKSSIHPPALQEGLLTLEGKADYEGVRREVFTRIAEHEGNIYLDLCDEDWRTVKISQSGWETVEDPPVRFKRSSGMLPLPMPQRGGKLDELRSILNVGTDEDWTLFAGWLIAALRNRGPYPVLILHGEQGAAKSTAARILRSIIDPNTASLRSAPKDERDLMIAANNAWCIAFDNCSHLPESMSNALCRLATGGGFATRELYSDSDEVIIDAQRPVLLNGIEEIATRNDLLDRAIIIYLPSIPEEKEELKRRY